MGIAWDKKVRMSKAMRIKNGLVGIMLLSI
jgi:hypothetical protein